MPVVVHCQMISPESFSTSDSVWNQQVVVRTIYIYSDTYIHTIAFNKKKAMNLRRIGCGIWEGLDRKNRKKKYCN